MDTLICKTDTHTRITAPIIRDNEDHYEVIIKTPDGRTAIPFNKRDWTFVKSTRKGESPEFCFWLRKVIYQGRWSITGISVACGRSRGWLSMICLGKSPLDERMIPILAEQLCLKPSTIIQHLRQSRVTDKKEEGEL